MDGTASGRDLRSVAGDINVLARFLGLRDSELSPAGLVRAIGRPQVDVFVLFGGSILAGGDVLAAAMRAGLARAYAIVGGAGHTTETFRARVRGLCPDLDFGPRASEAEVFEAYLESRHGLAADLLETRSTNCGNNITYLRELLAERGVARGSVVLAQDATMQRRMAAIAQKELPRTRVLSYATYEARVCVRGGALAFEDLPLGMWDMGRYVSLLMGEVPRLTDDERGYGPRGAGFLAHVDVPGEVAAAWERLRADFPGSVRAANPAYAG